MDTPMDSATVRAKALWTDLNVWHKVLLASILLYLTLTTIAIRRLWFHPLSKYPGPLLWRLTRIPYAISFGTGRLGHDVKRFHEQYGSTIRVSPDELSYINPDSIRDIYNKRPNENYRMLPKDDARHPTMKGMPVSIISAGETDHARLRKAWSHAFSIQALRAQEPLVRSYVEKLISQLTIRQASEEIIDLQKWFSYSTFDIIGSLSFGEDFGCLEKDRYHEWIEMPLLSFKAMCQFSSVRFFPWMARILNVFVEKTAADMMDKHAAMTKEKVQRRLSKTVDRSDFLTHLQKHKEGLTDGEIETNATTIIAAGSHTTTTAITGIIFLLLQNPDVLDKVTKEVRGSFATADDMTFAKLGELPLLKAAMQEATRLVTLVPQGLTREIPPGGATVCGEFLPPGINVSYMHWAANKSPSNFAHPAEFRFERWLDPAEYPEATPFTGDRRDAVQPFLQGPRDCLGKDLSRMEQLLVIGRVLYTFDISVPGGPESLGDWEDQDSWVSWDKKPLPVHLELRS